MKIFLQIKHWHLFLILILEYFSSKLIGDFGHMLLFITYYGWVYSIGEVLFHKLPEPRHFNIVFFRFNMALIFLIILASFLGSIVFGSEYDPASIEWTILPFLFYFFFSFLHVFYFASKILACIIEEKTDKPNTWMFYFLGFWLYIFGLWFIQPMVNKAYEKTIPGPAKF